MKDEKYIGKIFLWNLTRFIAWCLKLLNNNAKSVDDATWVLK